MELRETFIARIKAHLFAGNVSADALADDLLAIPGLDPTPLYMRCLAVLGFHRDDMPPEDVKTVQRFIKLLKPVDSTPPSSVE